MADDTDIWELEEKFWTGHEPFHEKTVPQDCVMVFGAPLGVLEGEAVRKALRDAPDWAGVDMSNKVLERPADNVAVTGYVAEGDAGNGVLHRVLCSSTWVRRDGDWHQVQHQQTPA